MNNMRRFPHFDPRYRCGKEINGLDFPSLAVDESGGPRDGALYLVWTERVTGTEDPIVNHYSDREPNDLPQTATPIELGASITGTSDAVDWHQGENDYFSFHLNAGESIVIRGNLFGFSSYPSGIETSCYPILVYGPDAVIPRMATQLAYTKMQLSSQGVSAPCIMSAPFTGSYYLLVPGLGDPFSEYYGVAVTRLHPDPTSVARDQRDIVMSVSLDGGVTWSPKRLVNDDSAGFDNSVAMVTVDKFGVAHVAWYDRSIDREHAAGVSVRATSTKDGGMTFAPSQQISRGDGNWRAVDEIFPLGDRFVFQAEADSLYAIWTDVDGPWLGLQGRVMPLFDLSGAVGAIRGLDFGVSRRIMCDATSEMPRGLLSLWREDAAGPPVMVSEQAVDGAGTHAFVDEAAGAGSVPRYRFLITPEEGFKEWGPEVTSFETVADGSGPVVILNSNPARGAARFQIIPAESGPVSVTVYDVRGRRIRHLGVDTVPLTGSVMEWDGRDTSGRPAAAGRYYIRATAGGATRSTSLTLVR